MDPYMFGAARFFWSWAAEPERPRPARRRGFFGRRRTEETQVPEPADQDHGQWPGLWLLVPVNEDEVIAFGRDLEAAQDVVGVLLAER